jgi:site-specific recombinase
VNALPTSLRIDQALRRFLEPAAEPADCFAGLFAAIRPLRGAPPGATYTLALETIEANPEYGAALQRSFLTFFERRKQTDFFADSGILSSAGFVAELAGRVSDRLLPPILDRWSLKDTVSLVLHASDGADWLPAVPLEVSRRFWGLLLPAADSDPARTRPMRDQMLEALLVVSHRVSALGLEPELVRNDPELMEFESPFLAQGVEALRVADAWRRSADDPPAQGADERHLLVLVGQCRDVLRRVRRTAMNRGTSLALTYTMVRLWQSLARIEALATVLAAYARESAEEEAVAHWTQFMLNAFRGEIQRSSVRLHFRQLFGLLALRVTDNAAQTGEHYVADTRPEYAAMWRSAMGAGLIIGVMALDKILAAKLGWAPLNQAFVYSMNYALGFVLIYLLHFTVATKQPAMTAQTIAATVSELEGAKGPLTPIVDLVAGVARTQLAAILGNVALALPTAIAVGWALGEARGGPFIDAGKALHLLHELDPLRSLAIPHAAIAGVCLFLSGLISGWVDNWTVYERIPERVGRVRWLQALAGAGRADAIGSYLGRHLGGIAGNFLFGIMLGSIGTIGALFGLPLDIRHVAFASANLGYALIALEFAVPWATVAWCALGVALIGFTNLAVSFALALWVALRARGAEFRRTGELLALLWREFRARPGRFFLPSHAAPAAPA